MDIAAPAKGHLHRENGYRVEAAKTFDEIKPEDYDILLIPGEPRTARLRKLERMPKRRQ